MAAVIGGFIALVVAVAGVGALSVAVAPPTAPAAAPAEVSDVVTADPDAAFKSYMRAIAPVVMNAVATDEAVGRCVDDESAPASAADAARCLGERLDSKRDALAQLVSVVAPPELRQNHAELLRIATQSLEAFTAYVGAFTSAVPELDRRRRRRRVASLLADDAGGAVDRVHEAEGPLTTSWSAWLAWIHPMNRQCNERLRCLGAWGRGDHGEPPPDYRPVPAMRANCPCPRVWNSFRGEGHEVIMTAAESGLAPFRGGIL